MLAELRQSMGMVRGEADDPSFAGNGHRSEDFVLRI
jgi:hypothetical protein